MSIVLIGLLKLGPRLVAGLPLPIAMGMFAGSILGNLSGLVSATIGDVWQQLKRDYPQLAHLSDTVVAALNQDYARLDMRVREGDEIAFIPPVSGGAACSKSSTK